MSKGFTRLAQTGPSRLNTIRQTELQFTLEYEDGVMYRASPCVCDGCHISYVAIPFLSLREKAC